MIVRGQDDMAGGVIWADMPLVEPEAARLPDLGEKVYDFGDARLRFGGRAVTQRAQDVRVGADRRVALERIAAEVRRLFILEEDLRVQIIARVAQHREADASAIGLLRRMVHT